MTIRVRFFALARDSAGKAEHILTVPEQSTVADLLEELFQQFPELRKLKEILRVAVNEEYSLFSQLLRDGDEVAVIPPVSGG